MNPQKFANLIEKGWSLDHVYILENIEDVAPLINFPKGASILQGMYRKGLIDDRDTITDMGRMFLEYALNEGVEFEKPKAKKSTDILEGLHKKLEDKLLELTGKKQKRVDIYGNRYSFLCNEQDLVNRIKKTMTKYKLSDIEAIETVLLSYIENCHKRNKWYPLIPYFILKNVNGIDQSPMATEIENLKHKEQPVPKMDFEI